MDFFKEMINAEDLKISYVKNFNCNFSECHFFRLVDQARNYKLVSDSICCLSNDEIVKYFECFEKTLWYYNDHLINKKYKIRNLYVLISLMYPKLNDKDIKFLTNTYNNIVQQWPSSGAILISETGNSVLLVKNNFSKTWSYPKGKINKRETAFDAAIRECYEETGYDISKQIDPNKVIIKKYKKKIVYLYVIIGIPIDFYFRPNAPNEIQEIGWFPLNDELSRCREYNMFINKSYWDLILFLKQKKNFCHFYSSS